MGLLSAIFGNGKPEENQQEKQTQKNFEILKYDGIRAHNMNQLAYAAKCLEQASALRDDAETLQYLADTYVKLQRTDDARTTLDKLTGLEPDNIQGYLFLANVCFAQEDYDGMDKACQKAIKLDESNAHAYYLAARAAHGLHNDLQAIVMATKAITQDESFLSAYLLRAEVLWSMKQAKETLEDLDYILNANPEEEDALLLKSTVKATLGETDEAYRCLDLVMETNPFNEKAYQLKGELLCGQKAYGKAIDRSRVTNIRELAGKGVVASVDEQEVAVGNEKLMTELGIEFIACRSIGTIVHIAVNGNYCGHIVIADQLKPNAIKAIDAVRKAGVNKVVMLTGDRKSVALAVASQLGIDEVRCELMPSDKVSAVEKLLAQRTGSGKLAFVGDGINDAPVLSRADIGIAMGAMGSDAAIEAADIVLMDDDPLKIAKGIKISRKCLRIVKENIWLAIGIKVLCLLLGAVGLANMWMAIFADVGVMILAILNAIRALFVKKL